MMEFVHRHQCTVKCRRIADGIVLWGGYDLQAGRPRAWDEREPGWRVTKEMLRDWNSAPASPR